MHQLKRSLNKKKTQLYNPINFVLNYLKEEPILSELKYTIYSLNLHFSGWRYNR